MQKHVIILLVLILAAALFPVAASASLYSISIETNPQIVDLVGKSIIKVKFIKGTNPVSNTQIFLGLLGISGRLKDEMLVTDKTGTATTEFIPEKEGAGSILAKTTVNDDGKIETIEALAPIIAKDLNLPPTPIVDQIYPLPARIGQPLVFKGHGIDPDSRIAKWQLSMGDGKLYEGLGETVSVSHIYAKPGTYEISFTVTDDRNATSKPLVSRVSVVDNRPPVCKINGFWPDKTYIGQEVTFGVILEDIEGRLSSCRIDFGDTTSENVKISGGSWKGAFRHKYARSGIFNVTVIPSDDQGDGAAFPEPAWPVHVVGAATGEAKLTITGALGKTIHLIGPLPLWKVAYEATVGSETILTGQILAEGTYRIVAADSSFGFTKQSGLIIIKPFETTIYESSVWTPAMKVEPVVVAGNTKLRVTITDTKGQELKENAVITASVDKGEIEGMLMLEKCKGCLSFNPATTVTKVTINANIGFVKASYSGNIQFPYPLPVIKLSPVSRNGMTEIRFESKSHVTGQMALVWKVIDRMTGKLLPAESLISNPVRTVFIPSTPYLLPVVAKFSNPGRYDLTVECQLQTGGITVSDSCRFDPCTPKLTLGTRWGYASNGQVILETQIKNELGRLLSGQATKYSYEFGRAIGYIPETLNFDSLPKQTTTDIKGLAVVNLDLQPIIAGLEVEDIKVTVRTTCSGVTFSESVSIPQYPKSMPKMSISVANVEGISVVTLKATDTSGNGIPGLWINIRCNQADNRDLEAMGYPPDSIRTGTQGQASFAIKPLPDRQIVLVFHASINGIPVTATVTVPKKG
jgi:PKD repeat protein